VAFNFGLGLVTLGGCGGAGLCVVPLRIYSTYIVLLSVHIHFISAARDKQRMPFWGEIEGGFTAGIPGGATEQGGEF
jgi:hypothetical protein